eukprot:Mrub_12866.p2 GENE.Mrub_12866~~Mrub_12866.p2  ORF type:complete len:150 (-),score=13.97 Mrub_12866:93-497(-)
MEDERSSTIPELPSKEEEIAYLKELKQSLAHNRDTSAPGPRRKLFQSIRDFQTLENERWMYYFYPRLGLSGLVGYILGESIYRWRVNTVAVRGGMYTVSKFTKYKYWFGIPIMMYIYCGFNFRSDKRGMNMIEL